jgi:8-oxo-(d)GTP phosphatase
VRTSRETAVVVRRGGELLVLHRAQDRYWHIVAGVVEEGEDFADAAARELREETGLEVALTDLRLPQSYKVPPELRAEYAAGVEQVEVRNFGAETAAAWEPTLNEEHDDYRWCRSADAIALVKWPETRELIASLADTQRTRT